MTTKRQYVIIIGAMKSGTTTLFDVLARHPKIAPARNKEPGFFAFDPIWSKGFDWFDTLFDFDPTQHIYRLEASTDYTKAPFVTGVWERMSAQPDVDFKLIYIMRHPLQRIQSHAQHVQLARKEIGQHISPKSNHSLDDGISLLNIATSRYAYQLQSYEQAWNQGQLHCLTLEELKMQPDETMSDIWDFLGLATPPQTTIPQSNAAGSHRQAHPVWLKLIRLKSLMTLGKMILPHRLRDQIKTLFQRQVKAEGRFTLSTDEATVLADYYRADIETLKTVYDVPPKAPWHLP